MVFRDVKTALRYARKFRQEWGEHGLAYKAVVNWNGRGLQVAIYRNGRFVAYV